MKNQIYTKIETILYGYACGEITVTGVHSALHSLGFRVDLRCWTDNRIDVENVATGEYTEIII